MRTKIAIRRTISHALAWLLLGAFTPRLYAQLQTGEYQIKAAFIYHFAQLVDWPPSMGSSSQSLNLCVIGDDPFHGILEGSIEGKVVGSRAIRIVHSQKLQETLNCQIVFLAKTEEKQIPGILLQLAAAPILTIGENDRFAASGGMIEFCLEDDKVRFNINVASAQKAGLKISSKLLLLAKDVIGGSGAK